MKNQNRLTICICVILFVVAVVLGLIFANFLATKKVSITTASIQDEKAAVEEEIENIISEKTDESLSQEEKQRLNELLDKLIKNCNYGP